jgi:hypothetical protein
MRRLYLLPVEELILAVDPRTQASRDVDSFERPIRTPRAVLNASFMTGTNFREDMNCTWDGAEADTRARIAELAVREA